MTLQEFEEMFYLHDSSLIKLDYDRKYKILKLYCILCNFMQKNYQEQEQENSNIIIIFYNAAYVLSSSEKITDWESESGIFLSCQ